MPVSPGHDADLRRGHVIRCVQEHVSLTDFSSKFNFLLKKKYLLSFQHRTAAVVCAKCCRTIGTTKKLKKKKLNIFSTSLNFWWKSLLKWVQADVDWGRYELANYGKLSRCEFFTAQIRKKTLFQSWKRCLGWEIRFQPALCLKSRNVKYLNIFWPNKLERTLGEQHLVKRKLINE